MRSSGHWARQYLLSTVFALLALVAVATPSCLFAQSYDNPGLGQQPVTTHPQDFKPLGIRAGGFMIHPGVELAAEWHDNILYTYDNELSDTIWHIRPYVTAQSTWRTHSFSVRLAADVARYDQYSFRDYEDLFFQLGGTIDVKERTAFSYGFDYMELHEERNIRSAEQGIRPTEYRLMGGNLGFDHTFNRFSIGLSWDIVDLEYKDNITPDGELIDNSDRDRTQNNLGARFGYQFKSDKQAFLTVGYQETEYDLPVDRNGYNRNSSGYSAGAGIAFTLTGVLSGDLSVDYHKRQYDSPVLSDVDGWGVSAGLHWMPTQLTTVHVNFRNSIEDTTQVTASGYFRTMYSVRAEHELFRNLKLSAMVSYYVNDYQLLPTAPDDARTKDDMWVGDLGATWFFSRWGWLSASYSFSNFSTNVPFDDFKANTAWLVLGLER